MNGANKNLEKALELLTGDNHSPLKQVEALKVFERSLNSMYLHRYELCAESFIEVSYFPQPLPRKAESDLLSVLILILGLAHCIIILPVRHMLPYIEKPSKQIRVRQKSMPRLPPSTSERHHN